MDIVVHYMQDQWQQLITHNRGANVLLPDGWTVDMAKDCEQAVIVIFDAWHNQCS